MMDNLTTRGRWVVALCLFAGFGQLGLFGANVGAGYGWIINLAGGLAFCYLARTAAKSPAFRRA